MTQDLGGDAVRYEGDRPVAVGDLRLAQPTRMATTSAGFWGLYEAGDEVLVVLDPGLEEDITAHFVGGSLDGRA